MGREKGVNRGPVEFWIGDIGHTGAWIHQGWDSRRGLCRHLLKVVEEWRAWMQDIQEVEAKEL